MNANEGTTSAVTHAQAVAGQIDIRIFISYRRNDSGAAFAGRIFDHLDRHFGRDEDDEPRFFRDVYSIRALFDLNRWADVAKVALDAHGKVTLLYEVPQVFPELVDRAIEQFESLQPRVRQAVG